MKRVTKKFDNVMDGINNLIKAANADYCDDGRWIDSKSETRIKMEEQFKNGWVIKKGKRYIGLYKTLGNGQSCIWGGVVNTDDHKKFKKGDILKAAGYGKYAMNAARGNVLEGDYDCQWTGANYL